MKLLQMKIEFCGHGHPQIKLSPCLWVCGRFVDFFTKRLCNEFSSLTPSFVSCHCYIHIGLPHANNTRSEIQFKVFLMTSTLSKMNNDDKIKFDPFCLHWSCSPSTVTSRGGETPMQTKRIKLHSQMACV